jgi:4-hydroxy-4-methyl-2-oxoglutarate aldolase
MTDGPADLVAQLSALGAATLGESGGYPMHPRLKPAWAGAVVAGSAFVVECGMADNLAIHAAVAEAPPGAVLVVNAGDPPERGYWGEVLTTGAEARGIAGLVIDGGVRDINALARHAFPVFSTMIALRGAGKVGGGSIGGSATVGDVLVEMGDWVVGDADGVTVIPRASVEEVVAAGHARAAKEEQFFVRLRDGWATVDLLGLDTGPVERRPHPGP